MAKSAGHFGERSAEQEDGWRIVQQRQPRVPRAMRGHPWVPSRENHPVSVQSRSFGCCGRLGNTEGERRSRERQNNDVFVSFLLNDINDSLVLDEVRKLLVITERG